MSAPSKSSAEVVPLNPADQLPATVQTKKPPRCTISATVVGSNSLDGVKLEHEPDALLAVLGDRSDTGAKVGETKDASPYALSMLNDLMSLALASETLTPGPLNAERVNAMIQQMSAFDPADELEGMIALQAVAMHRATMDSARRGLAATRADHRALYLGQANKCSRTFAALLEQLNRHRGKTTTQRVIVENVNVAAGGQAVVGAVAGGGTSNKSRKRAHEQAQTEADGRGPVVASLPCQEPRRQSVSEASDEAQEALQPSRGRSWKRSAKGKPECIEARSQHGGGDAGAPAGERDAERSAQPAGVKP